MAAQRVPLDMVGEILSWLPVCYVLKFRCVSKLWNSLTREDYFIYSHLERSKSKPLQIILHCDRFYYWEGEDVFEAQDGFALLDETWHPKLTNFNRNTRPWFPKQTFRSPSLAYCCGNSRPCNGLVCLYDESAKIRLCNPATREIQILPDATPARKQICSLGFVARTKEYKVVRLSDLGDHHYQVQVLTLGRGSWRRVGDLSSCMLLGGEGVHVDGTIHWMVRLDGNSEACTFCLDLTAEKLEQVKLPDSVQGQGGGELVCLAPWKGKLALVEIERPPQPSQEPGVINVYTLQGLQGLQGRKENKNVWNRIAFPMWAPSPLFTRADDSWASFGCLSFVGDDRILTWRKLTVYLYCNSSWSQIYGPDFTASPGGGVYGLYELEESLVPLEKSAMLYEGKFRGYEFRHGTRRPTGSPSVINFDVASRSYSS